MELVTEDDFENFLKETRTVRIANHSVPLGNDWRIVSYSPPKEYSPESDTVWSFPDRGTWATHNGKYRGNWSPYIPRNLIMKYTKPRELVLDQMVGSGTTLVECRLLGRDAIGVDINRGAIMIARDRLNFDLSDNWFESGSEPEIRTYVGDARSLNLIESDRIDLIAAHPPYAGIISYGSDGVAEDLSHLSFEDYFDAMEQVARESYRVLKPGKTCAILIGDTRRHLHYIPISARVLESFLKAGFILKEDIIKIQHNTEASRDKWKAKYYDFYKIAHEHLYIFRKPSAGEKLSEYKYSISWQQS
jgi:DNA modification methylase